VIPPSNVSRGCCVLNVRKRCGTRWSAPPCGHHFRVRIAVGIVAAQRRLPARRSFRSEQYWEDLDDVALDRLLKWFIVLAIVVKMLTVVGIALHVALAH
jgi:hypothetical protein